MKAGKVVCLQWRRQRVPYSAKIVSNCCLCNARVTCLRQTLETAACSAAAALSEASTFTLLSVTAGEVIVGFVSWCSRQKRHESPSPQCSSGSSFNFKSTHATTTGVAPMSSRAAIPPYANTSLYTSQPQAAVAFILLQFLVSLLLLPEGTGCARAEPQREVHRGTEQTLLQQIRSLIR